MFHLVLSVTVENAEQHNRAYNEMGQVQDLLAGEVPSINLSSYDMTVDLPDTEKLYLDENTMFKVINVFDRHGVYPAMTATIINDLLSAGILFRERRTVDGSVGEEDEGEAPVSEETFPSVATAVARSSNPSE